LSQDWGDVDDEDRDHKSFRHARGVLSGLSLCCLFVGDNEQIASLSVSGSGVFLSSRGPDDWDDDDRERWSWCVLQ
jgi:hypothetical protein